MSNNHADLLIEIHTEELPPKALYRLQEAFKQGVEERLRKAELTFDSMKPYATPRRLALEITALLAEQPDTTVERRGPALEAAFDASGKATPACQGFARSCGVAPEALMHLKTAQGTWVGYQQRVPGQSVKQLLPTIIEEALAALPIPKRMRWGAGTVEFVRPVHSVILLYGRDVIPATILGVATGQITSGHRFHCTQPLTITEPAQYAKILKEQGHVIADFNERKALIRAATQQLVAERFQKKAHALMDEALLDEVTGLVEWPVSLMGHFEERFLKVPAEALISAMQDHQRYFPIQDEAKKLLPYFVTTSNIASLDPARVVAGNERVIRARLSDAAFFFENDQKHTLATRVDALKKVVFQAKLGSLFDKTERVKQLSLEIAQALSVDLTEAERAALLCKTDLLTSLVGEFPELQGIAGYYYALHDGEKPAVAQAITEHYRPRYSGDTLPQSRLGCVLALADRMDTLVGVFGTGGAPTGDKDPFGLRRAALGILRILIEKELDLDLQALVKISEASYGDRFSQAHLLAEVMSFMQERLKPYYQEKGISADVFAAVAALNITRPYDFHRRVLAVQAFKDLPDAESLSVANKRVSNILAKSPVPVSASAWNKQLLEGGAEETLANEIATYRQSIAPLFAEARYVDVLTELSGLRIPVDNFFEHVMVMSDNPAQRDNRLVLLANLRALFLQVADVALLQPRS